MDVVPVAASTTKTTATAQTRGAGTAKASTGEEGRAQASRTEGLFGAVDQTHAAQMA